MGCSPRHSPDVDKEGGDGAADDGDTVPKKIRARIWYINPRFLVDSIKYRVFALRVRRPRYLVPPPYDARAPKQVPSPSHSSPQKFLERLESFEGSEAMYRCDNKLCRYVYVCVCVCM